MLEIPVRPQIPHNTSLFTRFVFVLGWGADWLIFIAHGAVWYALVGMLKVAECIFWSVDQLPKAVWSPCWLLGHRDNEIIYHPEHLLPGERAKYPNGYEVKHCDVCRRTVTTAM